MKRNIAAILSILAFLLMIPGSTIAASALSKSQSSDIGSIKAAYIEEDPSDSDIDLSSVSKKYFNTVILSVKGTRKYKKPYNTDFKQQKKLDSEVSEASSHGFNIIIDVTSGPGYSKDNKVQTIFKRRYEALYYAKMCAELSERYSSNKNFKGVSFNLINGDMQDASYTETCDTVVQHYSDLDASIPLLVNLNPASFENGFKDIPKYVDANVVMNASLSLKGLSYPGCSAGIRTSVDLNKNTILNNLQKLKDYEDDANHKVLISLKVPWVKNSEILLQDFFEINRMFKFNYAIYCSNGDDVYNFSRNSDVLKVLQRQK